MDTTSAQTRVDRIEAFEAELAVLDAEGVLHLSPEQQTAVRSHHAALRLSLAKTHDIDQTRAERRLSLGLRVASFIGALSFAGGVYLFLDRYIDVWPRSVATAVLALLPLMALALVSALKAREPSGYLARLAALAALSALAYGLAGFGALYNIPPSDRFLLVLSATALLLAFEVRSNLLVAFGILAFDAFIAMRAGTYAGSYWLDFGERPEHFFPAALAVLGVGMWRPWDPWPSFARTVRVYGLLTLLCPILVLANAGELSYLPLGHKSVEGLYQLAGFVLSASLIALGARRDWEDVVRVGVTFFVIFLYTKFYDWWWEALPAWAFFVIIGATAAAAIVILRRLRTRHATEKAV